MTNLELLERWFPGSTDGERLDEEWMAEEVSHHRFRQYAEQLEELDDHGVYTWSDSEYSVDWTAEQYEIVKETPQRVYLTNWRRETVLLDRHKLNAEGSVWHRPSRNIYHRGWDLRPYIEDKMQSAEQSMLGSRRRAVEIGENWAAYGIALTDSELDSVMSVIEELQKLSRKARTHDWLKEGF